VELVPDSGWLAPTPRSFRVGTVEQKVSWAPGTPRLKRVSAPQLGSIEAGPHRLTVTLTRILPSYSVAVRRNISALKGSGPLALLARIFGGTAGGVVAGMQPTLSWLVYELTLDGDACGSWVA
jgi:hypothetical protein